ncbi:FecCD family ABC transporter permease [Sessilibacter sp. MAH2]
MLTSLAIGDVKITFVAHLKFVLGYLSFNNFSDSEFFAQSLNSQDFIILSQIRWPRVLMALSTGVVLGVSGAAVQAIFRNPLADPNLIGISSGALLGASLMVFASYNLGFAVLSSINNTALISGAAFLGALIASMCVLMMSHWLTKPGVNQVLYMLLLGFALSAFTGAFAGLIKYFVDLQQLRFLSFWQLGNLQPSSSVYLWFSLISAVIVLFLLMIHSSALNLLALGEQQAMYLGVKVESLQYRVLLICSVGVGVSVACVGLIGFVSLIAPHVVRMVTGADNRWVIPLSGLTGAIILITSDVLARSLIDGETLPVGIITALVGAPWFIGVLMRKLKHS